MGLAALALFASSCGTARQAKTPAEDACDKRLGPAATLLVEYVKWTRAIEFRKAEVTLDRAAEQIDLARQVCPPDRIAGYDKSLANARAQSAANLKKYGP